MTDFKRAEKLDYDLGGTDYLEGYLKTLFREDLELLKEFYAAQTTVESKDLEQERQRRIRLVKSAAVQFELARRDLNDAHNDFWKWKDKFR